ncbi:hypothetical protein [Streptomyces sp. NPDC059979]|uniref:hypothetical protein n=1 Tax=Streptomyces sp. NPDC059979 TaxID=3347021 RepID=UPI0036C9E23B
MQVIILPRNDNATARLRLAAARNRAVLRHKGGNGNGPLISTALEIDRPDRNRLSTGTQAHIVTCGDAARSDMWPDSYRMA